MKFHLHTFLLACIALVLLCGTVRAEDLDDVLRSGTLRHLGIPYANFVTIDGQGLDVELMQAFAKHLGVKYQFVESSWQDIIGDLTGIKIKVEGDTVTRIGTATKKGHVISTGFTVLPWRRKIVSFSERTFPSGIWLVARSDSPLTPIKPTGNIDKDIELVKKQLKGFSILGLKDSCLEPSMYGIDKTGATIRFFPPDGDLSGMIPSVIAKNADATLIDVPVALIALAKWPGKIKVIGPVSKPQEMACAFAQDSPKLREAFAKFFTEFIHEGKYKAIVSKYYPSVFSYYPDFLSDK